jgi:hypothetical protein
MTTPVSATNVPPSNLAFDGDVGAEVALLCVESGQEAQSVEQQLQHADEDMASRAAADEVRQMREKADDIRTQGIVDGCATMGSGALQVAGASSGGSGFKAAASGLEGGAKIADGFYGAAEANADASAKEAERRADQANQAARDAHDAAVSGQGSVDKAIEFYERYSEAQSGVALAVVRRA